MKTKTIIASLLIAAFPSIMCYGNNLTSTKYSPAPSAYLSTTIIEQDLDLKNFKAISNEMAVEIHYTQGSKYKVTFKGTREFLAQCKFTVKEGTLRLKVKRENAEEYPNVPRVLLYVTTPNISKIKNDGGMTLAANINKGKAFSIKNDGANTLSGSINAKTNTEKCDGASTTNLTINAEDRLLSIDGAGKINSRFKGKNATIHCDGSSKIDLSVDCEKLEVTSDGMSKIKVRGTADNTSTKSDGVINVDASELNKF